MVHVSSSPGLVICICSSLRHFLWFCYFPPMSLLFTSSGWKRGRSRFHIDQLEKREFPHRPGKERDPVKVSEDFDALYIPYPCNSTRLAALLLLCTMFSSYAMHLFSTWQRLCLCLNLHIYPDSKQRHSYFEMNEAMKRLGAKTCHSNNAWQTGHWPQPLQSFVLQSVVLPSTKLIQVAMKSTLNSNLWRKISSIIELWLHQMMP